MALGGLGSAWSLKVAAVWTNLPVSHVTPSVSLGMWEDSAHPSSCHTVSVLSFLQKAFVPLLLEKGWPPTLSIQSGWLNFFFFLQNSKSQCFLFPCSKRSAVFDYIFAAFNLSFQQTFFFLFWSLLPSTVLKRKMKSRWSLSYWPVIKLLKMLSLTFDNESDLICNTSGKRGFALAPSAVKEPFMRGGGDYLEFSG